MGIHDLTDWVLPPPSPILFSPVCRPPAPAGSSADIGVEAAELLARVARRPVVNRQAEAEFWHRVGKTGQGLGENMEQRI
jgi:hypothetical protein